MTDDPRDRLGGGGSPYIHFVPTAREQADACWRDLRRAVQTRRPEAVVRRVDGDRCRGTADLFAEIAEALEFPDYFGHNWAALEDCLTDLGWLPAPVHVLVVADAEHLLEDSPPSALRALGRLVNEVTADDDAPFHLVLVAGASSSLARRLSEACVAFDTLRSPPGDRGDAHDARSR